MNEPNDLDSVNGPLASAFQLGRRMASTDNLASVSPFNDFNLTYAWEKGFQSHFYDQGVRAGRLGIIHCPYAADRWPLVVEAWLEGCAEGQNREWRRTRSQGVRRRKKETSRKTYAVWSRDGF